MATSFGVWYLLRSLMNVAIAPLSGVAEKSAICMGLVERPHMEVHGAAVGGMKEAAQLTCGPAVLPYGHRNPWPESRSARAPKSPNRIGVCRRGTKLASAFRQADWNCSSPLAQLCRQSLGRRVVVPLEHLNRPMPRDRRQLDDVGQLFCEPCRGGVPKVVEAQ